MSIYQIKSTDGVDTITIQPGQLNGPGGTEAAAVTDLDLYGQGTLNWGRGVDQNQLRLLENFACPGIMQNGRLRPVNKDDTGVPNYNEDNLTTGINNPVKGQLWHNTANGKTYVCEDPAATPVAIWETVAADPDLFLPLAGGTITGDLDIATATPRFTMTTTGGDIRLEFNDATGTKGLIALDEGAADTIIIRKQVGQNVIQDIQILDDGVEIIRGSSGQPGAGTIRVSETITAAHAGNTLTTRDYVDGQLNAFLPITGGQLTGNLRVQKDKPVITLQGTNSTEDVIVEMRDNTGDLRAAIVLDQTVPGQQTFVDNFSITKNNGTAVFGRFTIEDNVIVMTGAVQNSGALIVATSGANQGKAQTPSTASTDSNNTLTTKDYVDTSLAGAVALPSQQTGMTGLYRFGVPFADTNIQGPSIISTSAAGADTRINGNVVEIRDVDDGASTTVDAHGMTMVGRDGNSGMTFSADSAQLTIQAKTNSLASANVNFLLDDNSFNNGGLAFYQGSTVAQNALRGRLLFDQNVDGTNVDVLRLQKHVGSLLQQEIVLTDTSTDFRGSNGANVNLQQTNAASFAEFGINFQEELANGFNTRARLYYADVNGAGTAGVGDSFVMERTSQAGALSGRIIIDDNGISLIDGPVFLAGTPHHQIDDRGTAQRRFVQPTKPAAGHNIEGDLWFDTSSDNLYIRRTNDWAPILVGTPIPL